MRELPEPTFVIDGLVGYRLSGPPRGRSADIILPKTGLLTAEAAPYVGQLYLADIGFPQQVFSHIGIEVGDIFGGRPIVRLEPRP